MKIKINILFFVFWAFFALMKDTTLILYIFIASAFHEIAHICAFTAFGAEILSIELLPFGISATLKNNTALTSKKEIFCALAGPIANLFLVIFLFFLPETIHIDGIDFFLYCNAAIFAINILPALPLDGGRVLWFLFLLKFPYLSVKKYLKIISAITSLVLFILGVFLLIFTRNFSLLIIAVYLVLCIFFENI